MSKEDTIGILGAGLSSFFAIFGFLWNIGAIQFVSSFLAGSFTTYVIQHRLQMEAEKRKTERENAIVMRDTIYGPIFMELSKILEEAKQGRRLEYPPSNALKGVMDHYLFYSIGEELKNRLYEILARIEKYERIYSAVYYKFNDVINKRFKENYNVNLSPSELTLRVQLDVIMVDAISLTEILFKGITPENFLENAIKKYGQNTVIDISQVIMGNNIDTFNSFYKLVLDDVEKEVLYKEEKDQRTYLISELEGFRDQIKVFINVK